MEKDVGLVVALDLVDKSRALKVAEEVADYAEMFKVNYPLVLSAGISIIKELSEIKPVIADFKIADIPYTSGLIAQIAFEWGAKSLICHGFVGSDTVKAILSVAENYNGEVYVVSELSSEGGKEYMLSHSNEIARMARKLGCHGIVAPATRVSRVAELREIVGDLKIFSPGIGAQKGDVEVVKYVDYVIVGRGIYNAENPKKAAEEMLRKIESINER